jgi:hypothetical protein
LSCAALVACTSLHTLVDTRAAGSEPAPRIDTLIQPHDSITVTRQDGSVSALQVTAVTPELIEGTQGWLSTSTRIALVDVVKIERREFDGARTTLLVVAVFAGAYFVAKSVAEASLAAGI